MLCEMLIAIVWMYWSVLSVARKMGNHKNSQHYTNSLGSLRFTIKLKIIAVQVQLLTLNSVWIEESYLFLTHYIGIGTIPFSSIVPWGPNSFCLKILNT